MIRLMVRFALMLLMLVANLLFTPVYAQDAASLPVITPENVAQISPLTALESDHPGAITWSPDGSLLAVGATTGTRIYPSTDLTAPPVQLAGGLDVLFNPSGDTLVSGGSVWDVATQRVLFSTGDSDERQFSPGGRFLVTAKHTSSHTDFVLWDVNTGESIDDFTIQTESVFQRAVFSDDESQYALVFQSANSLLANAAWIQVRDTHIGRMIAEFMLDYEIVTEVLFTHQGQRLVVNNQMGGYGGMGSKVIFYDLTTQTPIREIESDEQNTIFSPDGRLILSNEYDSLKLTRMDTGEPGSLRGYRLDFSAAYDSPPRFSPDSRYVVSPVQKFMGDYYETGIAIWDLQAANGFDEPGILIQGADDFAFSPDGHTLVINAEGEIRLWDMESQAVRLTLPGGRGRLRFMPDGRTLIADDQGNIQVWDTKTGALRGQVQLDSTRRYTFSPASLQAAYVTPTRIQVVDLVSGAETALPIADSYLGRASLLDAAHGLAAFQGEGSTLHLMNLATGGQLLKVPNAERLTISPDGRQYLVWTNLPTTTQLQTGVIYTWDDPPAAPVLLKYDPRRGNQAVFSPPDLHLIYLDGGELGVSMIHYLFDSITGEKLAEWPDDPELYLSAAAFSPDGRYLVTALKTYHMNGGNRVEIWDVQALLTQSDVKPLVTIFLYGDDDFVIFDPVFTPDGQTIIIPTDSRLLGDGPAYNQYRIAVLPFTELIQTGGEVVEYDLGTMSLEGVYKPILSPDTAYVLTRASSENWNAADTLVLWERTSGKKIVTLAGYNGGVFSPDGALLAAYTADGLAFWDVPALLAGETTPLFVVDSPNTWELAFSPAGDRLYQRTEFGITTWAVTP